MTNEDHPLGCSAGIVQEYSTVPERRMDVSGKGDRHSHLE